MGYVRDVCQSALPAGLQFLARPWDEGRLLGIAYAFEQATQYRMCAPDAAAACACCFSSTPTCTPCTSAFMWLLR